MIVFLLSSNYIIYFVHKLNHGLNVEIDDCIISNITTLYLKRTNLIIANGMTLLSVENL
jgi:hypothetical protein